MYYEGAKMNTPPQLYLSSVEISENNKEKGFHTGWDNIPEKLMLVVTELAEAMEEYRKIPIEAWQQLQEVGHFTSHTVDTHLAGKVYDNFEMEIADTFIRLMDICGALGLDIDQAIVDKVAYNKTRPYKHGKEM